MISNNSHYQQVVKEKKKTRMASCGYADRFDPFLLNKNPSLRNLYGKLFKEFLPVENNNYLLDIGCGTGIYFDVLAKHAKYIHAIDYSLDMVQVANQYCKKNNIANISTMVGDAIILPFGDESFNIVIELDVMHHIENPNRVLFEVYRVLKPGGIFFVFEPNICNPLTFFAHLLPKEERMALGLNRPQKLVSFLENVFESKKWQGVCGIVTQTKGFKRFLLDIYLNFWNFLRFQKLYPRQAWIGIKRNKEC